MLLYLGVDTLNVVRHVFRILEGRVPCRPFDLTFDGDLLTIIERMIHLRAVQSTKVCKVKGHADDDMIAVGRVGVEDRIGNDLADRAADFGRRRVSDLIIDVRRRFLCLFFLVSCCFRTSSFLYCHRSCCCQW